MNIYELTGNYLKLQDMMESGEYDADALTDTLESLDGEIEQKAERIAMIIKNLSKDVDGLKAEEKRLSDKRKALESKADYLKKLIESMMLETGKDKFKTDHFSFGIQNNPPSLKILDESAVPKKYFKVVKSIDTATIKELIRSGKKVKGATLEQTRSLRIR